MTAYEFFKDFAGPIATVIAATVAAGVTAAFAYRQVITAEQQSETARNKLRADTFKMRFDVYSAAVEVCRIALYRWPLDLNNRKELNLLSAKVLEGEFMFSRENFQYLMETTGLCQHLVAAQQRHEIRNGNDPQFDDSVKKLETIRDKIGQRFEDLPHKFMDVLSIDFQAPQSSHNSIPYLFTLLATIGALIVALAASLGCFRS
ncbi:MAG: hypothetical protein Q7T93_16775 [Methylobacterium sp.]|uniref:hypothetical protein n=1 Tax=Methylobacterium sp. TaxID=409 RepID=UPI00271F2382|nr:hypothetical protein [Methylobacterium sp.]MDO9428473.1 hypothetical protein [Methylobacterium sp.]